MPQSGIKQDPIWVRKIDNNEAYVKLRKNFTEKVGTDDDGNETKVWVYDETDVIIKNRPNLHKYIQDNFDSVWYSNPEELAKKLLHVEQ